MLNPTFLTVDEVLQVHAYQVTEFGGAPAVLNIELLESAIAMPAQAFGGQFVHEDLAGMAAAYLFHIVKNHPFEDGNKRTGMHAAILFLDLNGQDLKIPVDEGEDLTLNVAKGIAGKKQIAEFFRALMTTG